MTGTERVVRLAADLASVAAGRRFVREVLVDAGLEELCDDAQLATSELVANAVRHAGTPVVLRVFVGTDVRVSVEDGRPELRQPVPVGDAAHAESGRGLRIVAAVSTDWGLALSPAGKVVWFTMTRPDLAGPDAEVRGITPTRRSPGAGAPSQRARASS